LARLLIIIGWKRLEQSRKVVTGPPALMGQLP
jgi:hypothetical protein